MSTSNIAAIPRNHVVTKESVEGVNGIFVPALYIQVGSETRIVESLIGYFLSYPGRSYDWRRKVSRSLGLFFDYTTQYAETFNDMPSHIEMVRKFGLALLNGTVSPDNPMDEMKLYWPPSTIKNVKQTISRLDGFIKWCVSEGLVSDKAIKNTIEFEGEDQFLKYISVAMKIKDLSFLGHTTDAKDLAERLHKKDSSRIIDFGTSTNVTNEVAKTFPTWLVPDLIKHGFVIDESADELCEKEDLNGKMITILLLFGGLRKSEPYHLWFNDVVPQMDGTCKVILRHPRDSLTEIPYDTPVLRSQYLAARKLYPRNTQGINKSYYAGWKNLALDSSLQASVFFLHSAAESLFRSMFIYYLHYRAELLEKYKVMNGADHPFLFVSKGGDMPGAPYSMASYGKSLERAYKRLEKRFGYDIPRGKNNGTTPHGMRHFYGQALTDAEINQKIIQKALHHRSILSQSVYTEPKDSLVREILNKAKIKLDSEGSHTLTHEIIGALGNE